MANTTNFNWETPDDTDLVKDGAAAIRTLGSAIDTSLVDLKGGTTGQVLAKNSNTDMDFIWSADASGIPATIFDAKGDLIVASAADTAARLAVGTNGHVLTANSGATNGVEWTAPAAGGMTLLSTTTLSGTSTLISSVNQGYNNLFIIIKNIDVSSATNAYVRIEPNSTTNAVSYSNQFATGGTIATQGDATFPGMPLSYSEYAASNTNNALALEIYNYASTTSHKPFNLSGAYVNTGSATVSINSSGSYRSNTEITEFRVYSGSGSVSFNGGTVLIYGVK